MEIPYIKMEMNGNNYLILLDETLNKSINLPLLAQKICNVSYGVGADGILVIDYKYRPIPTVIQFNKDGKKENTSGDSLRIVSQFLLTINKKDSLKIKTDLGLFNSRREKKVIYIKYDYPDTYTQKSVYYKGAPLNVYSVSNPYTYKNHLFVLDDQFSLDHFQNELGKFLSEHFRNNECYLVKQERETLYKIVRYLDKRYSISSDLQIISLFSILKNKVNINEPIHIKTDNGEVICKCSDDYIEIAGPVHHISKGNYYF